MGRPCETLGCAAPCYRIRTFSARILAGDAKISPDAVADLGGYQAKMFTGAGQMRLVVTALGAGDGVLLADDRRVTRLTTRHRG
jgi:hypothetical protein